MDRKLVRSSVVVVLAVVFAGTFFLAGCSRDPNVRKQKYFESGKRYMAKEKYREAAIQFSNALRIDSKFAQAHYQLAICDLKLGSGQNAYAELVRATYIDPSNLEAQLDLGNLLLAGRDFHRAADRADFVLSRDPNNVNAHILKAEATASLRQLDQALAEMNTAVQLDPKRSPSYLTLGVLETTKAPQSPAAEADFKKAIELDGKAIPPRIALAAFYDGTNRYPEAEQQLQDAVRVAPKNQQVRAAFVRHYLAQGQRDLAEKSAKDTKAAVASDPDGAQFLARYYLSVNDAKAATSEYQQLAKQFPSERQIQHSYLDLLMLQEQNDAALKQVNAILKKFSKDNQALTDKGVLLLQGGKAAEARDTLQAVVKADPQNVVALYSLGNSFKLLGDTREAESEWHEAVRVQPSYLPAERSLAELALLRRDFRALGEIAQIVKEKVPNAPEGYELQAQVDASNNEPGSAETELEKAIQIAPRKTSAYVGLGRLLIATKKYPEAEKALDRALEINPEDNQALNALVLLYLQQKQTARAREKAEDTARQFPNDSNVHLVLGRLCIATGDMQCAESELTRAAQLVPRDSGIAYQLASVQVSRHEFPSAQSTLQLAAKENPADPSVYWMLGTVFEQEQNVRSAEASYHKALELQPENGTAANNLAYLLLETGGDVDQAITYAELARRQMPNSPVVADTLGWAYCKKGRLGLAVEILKDAVKGVPKNPTFRYHLGLAYSRAGDQSSARVELKQAAQMENDKSKKDAILKSLASLT